jgi:Kef-type K+ transport system membrane component KefB
VASIALVVVAVVGKFTGVFAASLAARLNRWEALAVGAGMNARGAVQMIIAMVGLRLHVLNTETYTMVMLVAIVTSLMAPPILRWSMRHVEHTAEERLRENTWKPAAARAEEGTS